MLGFLDKPIPYRRMYNVTTRPAQTPAHPRGSVTSYGRSPGSWIVAIILPSHSL